MKRFIESPPLDFRAAVSSVDAGARSFEVRFSSGAGVRRRDWASGVEYTEVLSLDPAHVHLDRLNGGAPVLNSHGAGSLSDVIGVVENARIAGPADARAKIRISRRPDVEPIFQDIADGIVKNCSVGYRVERYEETRTAAGLVRTATSWTPFEISLVPIGADAAAQVRAAEDLNRCEIVQRSAAVEPPDDEPVGEQFVNRRFQAQHLRCFTDDEVIDIWAQLREEAADSDPFLADVLGRAIGDLRYHADGS